MQNYCCRISHVVTAGIEMQNSCESLSWKLEAVLCFINKPGSSDTVRDARRGVEGAQLYDRLHYSQLSTTTSYSETLSQDLPVYNAITLPGIRQGLRARRRRKILRYFEHYYGGNASKVDHFGVGNFCRQPNTHLLSPGTSKTDIFLKSVLFLKQIA